MTATAPARRLRHPMCLGAVVVVGLALAGTGSAVAGPSPSPAPSSPPPASEGIPAATGDGPYAVDLMPGAGTPYRVVAITDDAIYTMTAGPPGDMPVIYGRSLTTGASGITVGPATFIAHGALDGAIAAREGAVAYARAVDSHLVLRATDGTETVPEWAGYDFSRGMGDLTANWISTNTLGSWPRLFNMNTGTEVDLRAITPPVPAGITHWGVFTLRHSDDRVMWTIDGSDDAIDLNYRAVLTSALDENGPTGPVVTLDEELCSAGSCGWEQQVAVEGDTVVWRSNEVSGATYRWYTGEPYTGTPHELVLASGQEVSFSGSEVAIWESSDSSSLVRWHDLDSDPLTPTREVTVPGSVVAVHGSLVAFRTASGDVRLTDADGLSITADPTPVVTPWFTDVPASEFSGPGFAGEITWLADHGIVGGYPDGTYRGLTAVSRRAMAAFLYRTTHDGADAPACTVAPFADVATTDPFCGEITWLADTAITTGWPDHTFRPTQPVSREAMAAFLYRLANDDADAPACTVAPFTDVATTNPFCAEITWLADTAITTGWPDGTFHPTTAVSRQAMAAFLFRYIDAGLVPTTT